MEFSIDKALLWLLPYLFLLSIAYYIGYWGFLDIDTFNYHGVQDLVKGIALPIAFPAVASLGLCIVIVFMLSIPSIFRKLKIKRNYVFIILVILEVLLIIMAFYVQKRTETEYSNAPGTFILNATYYLIASVAGFGYLIYHVRKSNNSDISNTDIKVFIKSGIIFAIVFLPLGGNLEARKKAWNLKNNVNYNYIKTTQYDSIFNHINKPVLKYAGKAGDYCFFLSQDNNERVIVPASQFKVLTIYNFNKSDFNSVIEYQLAVQQFIKTKRHLNRISPSALPAQPLKQKRLPEVHSTGRRKNAQ